MMEFKIFESMVHPIRMKIIQEVIKRKTATVKDIADSLSDVPPASLYRQINKLVSDNVLEISAENKVRGTLEKVYRIKFNPYEELNRLTEEPNPEQILNLFYNFSMTLLADFQSYISKENVNPEKDGVGFRSYPLYLTDGELAEMLAEMREPIIKRIENKPSPERKLRKLSTVITPIDE
jgi:DNA-binding PadR family transcriptional regulator